MVMSSLHDLNMCVWASLCGKLQRQVFVALRPFIICPFYEPFWEIPRPLTKLLILSFRPFMVMSSLHDLNMCTQCQCLNFFVCNQHQPKSTSCVLPYALSMNPFEKTPDHKQNIWKAYRLYAHADVSSSPQEKQKFFHKYDIGSLTAAHSEDFWISLHSVGYCQSLAVLYHFSAWLTVVYL